MSKTPRLPSEASLDAPTVNVEPRRRCREPLPPVQPRLLRIREAAEYLRMSAWQIRQLVQAGRIAYIPGNGETSPWLFDRNDLDAFIEHSKVRFSA